MSSKDKLSVDFSAILSLLSLAVESVILFFSYEMMKEQISNFTNKYKESANVLPVMSRKKLANDDWEVYLFVLDTEKNNVLEATKFHVIVFDEHLENFFTSHGNSVAFKNKENETQIVPVLIMNEPHFTQSTVSSMMNPDSKNKRPLKGLRVFLCYSRTDIQKVNGLYNSLCEQGVETWFDEKSLLPGQEWDMVIHKSVQQSHVVIVCISKDSVTKKGYVNKEIKYALDVADEQPEGTIFIIPARLDNCEVPFRLKQLHWVDLFESNGFDKLMLSLRERHKKL